MITAAFGPGTRASKGKGKEGEKSIVELFKREKMAVYTETRL